MPASLPRRSRLHKAIALALLGLLATLAGDAGPPAERSGEAPAAFGFRDSADAFVFRNRDGEWTVYKRCLGRRAHGGADITVGPGYIARFVTWTGEKLVEDEKPPGTLNDTDFGGLGAFGWHHARGRPGRLRFRTDNAWEVNGRTCAADNGGFGVLRSRVLEPPHLALDEQGERFAGAAVEVLLSDAATYPRSALVRVVYRYRVYESVVKSWMLVSQHCAQGACGHSPARAFIKEPKFVAHVVNGERIRFTRMATFDAQGNLDCIFTGGGRTSGPILETGQCPAEVTARPDGADDRARLRFDFGGVTSGAAGCEPDLCLNVVMRAYPHESVEGALGGVTHDWERAGLGLDLWAQRSLNRAGAFERDTGSVDGVVWDCHGSSPAADGVRRWETTGRKDDDGEYVTLGGLFPAWEGGRGGYDCEPLARVFGPEGESFGTFASYSLGPGWEELR